MARKGVSEMVIIIIFLLLGAVLLYGASYVSGTFFPGMTNLLSSKIQCVKCLFNHNLNECVKTLFCLK